VREKRLATILYADLTGFTELTSKLGPERIAEFVNECFRTLDSIIHIHDGTVLRHEGDRVMAIFGFPKSHGYDSYSAVLSGLRILEATKEITQSMGTHLGIATGEVICEDGNVYGPVIDTASLLEEKADLNRLAEIVNQENEEELYEFLLGKGRYLESICEYDEAIKLYDGYPDKEKRVKVLERLGMVYYCKGQFSKTIETLVQALALARKNYRSLKDTRAISTILISKFSKL
jgi:tetratricopeptide (TPR) repeat protein